MEWLRAQPFEEVPGVAESLDWPLALTRLHRDALDEATLQQTLRCILKVRADWELLRAERARYTPLLQAAEAPARAQDEPDYGLGSVVANRG
ncbi:hypothetical protein WPS_18270 [Vulcanimicrobium alpinum]|uniref:Uncharacterized protein n=1 Tax=Vulcanimicrobium alpinum TaxID=3016050 RepID=A0AAN2C9Z3_UNVUL|nr:hypothetical protein [Vulcanimicrobium alpinum]BDE06551.1 hypothetical protein WPS_18270 [Vulcanimicrobium alpinum]